MVRHMEHIASLLQEPINFILIKNQSVDTVQEMYPRQKKISGRRQRQVVPLNQHFRERDCLSHHGSDMIQYPVFPNYVLAPNRKS